MNPWEQRQPHVRVLFWMAELAILYVFWLIYVDSLALHELLVGAGAAVLAAMGAEAVRGMNFAGFYPSAREALQVWRVPGMVLDGYWVLIKVLVLRNILGRDVKGEFRTVRFDPGGDDARSAGRRALAVTLTTLAPNFIVVWIDRKQHLMLYHQVLGASVPEVTKKLGAMV